MKTRLFRKPAVSAWLLTGCFALGLVSCREDPRYLLSLSVSTWSTGAGTVSADPPGPYYAPGTVVQITAYADTGSLWWGWKDAGCGKYDSIGDPNPVIMDGDKDLRATFSIPEISGNGLDDDLDGLVDE